MIIKPDQLTDFFQNAAEHHLVHRATLIDDNCTANVKENELVGYLNSTRPYLINIVGDYEIAYLNALSTPEQIDLIDHLSSQGTQYLIFNPSLDIPKLFINQHHLHIAQSEYSQLFLQQHLACELIKHFANRESLHGSFVVIQGQGILISGDSGTGKSSLLLDLVKQNHLWVADDSPLFYLNANNQIIGHSSGALSEFVHVKGLGPINMDKSFGQANRIPSHPLAAVIHLSNNSHTDNKHLSAYTQRDMLTLHNRNFPMWHLPSNHPNLTSMVESCAKSLILNEWGYDGINGLENALNNALSSDERTRSSNG